MQCSGASRARFSNLTLGWATLLLFGKVPQHKQFVLLLIVFGSLAWVALLVGIVVPDVGTFLIALVPAPDFIEENWIRLAMVLGAVIVPLGIGAAAVFVTAPENRPRGLLATAKAILRGYPFALVLARDPGRAGRASRRSASCAASRAAGKTPTCR